MLAALVRRSAQALTQIVLQHPKGVQQLTTRLTTTCDTCGQEQSAVISGRVTWQEAHELVIGWYEHIRIDPDGRRTERKHFCTFGCLMDWIKKEAA